MTRAADDLCIISELSVITAENYLQCLKQCLSMGISCQALTYYTDNVCGLSNSTGVADNCTSAGAVTYISAPKLPLGRHMCVAQPGLNGIQDGHRICRRLSPSTVMATLNAIQGWLWCTEVILTVSGFWNHLRVLCLI